MGNRVKDRLNRADISPMKESTPPIDTSRERLHLLFQQSRSTSTVAAVAAAVTATIIFTAKPTAEPWIWLGFVLTIAGARHLLYRRFFRTSPDRHEDAYWLRWHAYTAAPVGIAAGALPLLQLADTPIYVQELQTLVPALVAMAGITSFGVYFRQYMVLLIATGITTVGTRFYIGGAEALPVVAMFALFGPILALTARRYGNSLLDSMQGKRRSEQLVQELTIANSSLEQRNQVLARQRDLIDQEEALARHVFEQLTLGGDHQLPGIHTWNQSMGNLSGDLTQTAHGPDGQAYVFLERFHRTRPAGRARRLAGVVGLSGDGGQGPAGRDHRRRAERQTAGSYCRSVISAAPCCSNCRLTGARRTSGTVACHRS